jgi:hypothetical protein
MSWSGGVVIAVLVLIVIGSAAWLFVYPRWRHRRIEQQPFPERWLRVVKRDLPFFQRMPAGLQIALKNQIKHFLANKRFTGCAGFVMTDDVRISIAAQACLLILQRPGDYYSSLKSILVYPSEFLAAREGADESGLVSHKTRVMAGEAWSDGKIILSWESVARGAADFADGYNVVLHEFAHQLDNQFGHANGAPWLSSHQALQDWSRVFNDEFTRLRQLAQDPVARSLQTEEQVLDFYGASEPAEFFAVATEAFFERPYALAARHPQLYEQLQVYYRVDPRHWQY